MFSFPVICELVQISAQLDDSHGCRASGKCVAMHIVDSSYK